MLWILCVGPLRTTNGAVFRDIRTLTRLGKSKIATRGLKGRKHLPARPKKYAIKGREDYKEAD